MRFSFFETFNSSLVANQTLEPTQVAGFNQFFDDINGTRAQRKGIGFDVYMTKNIFGGVEVSTRDLKVPIVFLDDRKNDKQTEKLYRGYLYWTPHSFWAVKGEFQFEQYIRNQDPDVPIFTVKSLYTFSAPISVEYFHPSGIFSGITGTFVRQRLTSFVLNSFPEQQNPRRADAFFILDAVIGYRLPNRRGILSLEGRNLLDQQFLYRNFNLQFNEESIINLSPTRSYNRERAFFARFTWNF